MSTRPVIFLLSSLAGGGSQRKTIRLINVLVSEGYRVHLCYLDKKEELLTTLEPASNLHVDCLGRQGRYDTGAMERFAQLASAYRNGTVVGVNPYAVFFAARSLRASMARFKFVAATNTFSFRSRKEAFLFHVFQKRLYRDADLVLFGSKAQQERWCRSYSMDREKTIVIYNGVDIDHFSPDARVESFRVSKCEDTMVIVLVASLRPHKRHLDLLEAAKLFLARGRDLSLVFAGAGPLAPALEKRAKSLNLGHRVTFTGFVDDVRSYLRAADVAVLPSVETFSNAILEAMAMGKPVIASNLGGAAEQVTHGVNGFLFEPGNVEELADCIERLHDPAVRIEAGREARRTAVERFGLEQMVEAYKKILD